MNTEHVVETTSTRRVITSPFTWRALLHVTAIANILVLTVMGILLPDRLPLGIAMVIALGLWLQHWRGGVPGIVVLGVIFADTTFWTLGASLSNVGQGVEPVRLVIPASLAAISGAGFVAAIAVLFRPQAGGKWVGLVGVGALALFLALIAAGSTLAGEQAQAARPDVSLTIENMAFSTREITVQNGQITVEVDNHDVWWHTFTVDGLNVDLKVPSSGKRQITFNARPGTYRFYCSIPGHAELGMQGTLTVR